MIELHIPGMSCGHCKQAITEAVQTVDQTADLAFDMEARQATINSTAQSEMLIKAIADAGYEAKLA